MIFWLTALAVWVAAGARVGRVLVRPATTVRVAIVVAVMAVALAATVAIPGVADTIDGVMPDGLHDGAMPAAHIGISLWVFFIAATSVIAAAAWPMTSRTSLRLTGIAIYVTGGVLVALTLLLSARIGWFAIAIGSAFIVVTAARNLDWTPLGRGIALFGAGVVLVGVLAGSHALDEQGTDAATTQRPSPGWAFSGASLLISLGVVLILIEVWVRARVLLVRVRSLHRLLTDRFPEVAADDLKNVTTVLKSSDQVAHIMDALYLQAGGMRSPNTSPSSAPPEDGTARAHAVAMWAHDPFADKQLDSRWIAPPAGMSTRRWVRAIATAYSKEFGG